MSKYTTVLEDVWLLKKGFKGEEARVIWLVDVGIYKQFLSVFNGTTQRINSAVEKMEFAIVGQQSLGVQSKHWVSLNWVLDSTTFK